MMRGCLVLVALASVGACSTMTGAANGSADASSGPTGDGAATNSASSDAMSTGAWGGTDGSTSDAPSSEAGVTYVEFGKTCAADAECGIGRCIAFGNGQVWCTLSCAGDQDCPAGSQGRKCNNKGYCRP